jgi:hypothetical protein
VIAIAVTTALPMTLSNQMFIFMYDPVLQYGFTYFELGDGDELGKTSFQNYFEAHKSVYLLLKNFMILKDILLKFMNDF